VTAVTPRISVMVVQPFFPHHHQPSAFSVILSRPISPSVLISSCGAPVFFFWNDYLSCFKGTQLDLVVVENRRQQPLRVFLFSLPKPRNLFCKFPEGSKVVSFCPICKLAVLYLFSTGMLFSADHFFSPTSLTLRDRSRRSEPGAPPPFGSKSPLFFACG